MVLRETALGGIALRGMTLRVAALRGMVLRETALGGIALRGMALRETALHASGS
jgi:hypothetical protein